MQAVGEGCCTQHPEYKCVDVLLCGCLAVQISDSEDDAELALAAEGSDDNEGGGSPKAKRARPARAAAAAASGGGGGGGEGAAFVAPAAVGGMLPLVAPYVPPSDTAQGAADVYPAAEPLKLCLSELNFV